MTALSRLRIRMPWRLRTKRVSRHTVYANIQMLEGVIFAVSTQASLGHGMSWRLGEENSCHRGAALGSLHRGTHGIHHWGHIPTQDQKPGFIKSNSKALTLNVYLVSFVLFYRAQTSAVVVHQGGEKVGSLWSFTSLAIEVSLPSRLLDFHDCSSRIHLNSYVSCPHGALPVVQALRDSCHSLPVTSRYQMATSFRWR